MVQLIEVQDLYWLEVFGSSLAGCSFLKNAQRKMLIQHKCKVTLYLHNSLRLLLWCGARVKLFYIYLTAGAYFYPP